MKNHKTPQSISSRLIKDPLIKFLIISVMLYAIYGFFGQQESDAIIEENTIHISSAEIAQLENSWKLRWNRPATEEEKEVFTKKYIREMVLYREAIKMGLDKDDVVIRRRVVLTLRRFAEQMLQPGPPTAEELQSYFETHTDDYRTDDILTFTQIFFDPDKREETTLDDAEKAANELKTQSDPLADISNYGDLFMLKNNYEDLSRAGIQRLFGRGFTDTLMVLEPKQWHGPVLSGYGTHIVYINEKNPGEVPKLEAVKEIVITDWKDDKNKELNQVFFEHLIANYEIIIEEQENIDAITK